MAGKTPRFIVPLAFLDTLAFRVLATSEKQKNRVYLWGIRQLKYRSFHRICSLRRRETSRIRNYSMTGPSVSEIAIQPLSTDSS